MKALVALEDGTIFEGTSFTGPVEAAGEIVFNTSMTGYQEILTDPSYTGQIVTMTSSDRQLWRECRGRGIGRDSAGGLSGQGISGPPLKFQINPATGRFSQGVRCAWC